MIETESTADDIGAAGEVARTMRAQIGRAVVGQAAVIDQVLATLFAAGHALVEGVPGLGKTLLVKAMAQSFAGAFTRIQFTPDLMPADVTGHAIYDHKSEEFRIRKGPVFTNLLLADEINRAPAKTQAALLEVMQESQVTIEARTLPLAPPFMTMATQNPIELEGTYPLPEAQLDRFLMKILIDYPTDEEELMLVRQVTSGQAGDGLDVSAVEAVVSPADVQRVQGVVSNLTVDEQVHAYAIRIVRRTREWPGVALGAGPRGAIAIVRAARAAALLDGRDFVTPHDVKTIATPCLRHRLVLAPELQIEGHGADDILAAILDKVEAPRQ